MLNWFPLFVNKKVSIEMINLISWNIVNCENSSSSIIYANVIANFAGKIGCNSLSNYAYQTKSVYITKDNTAKNL
jgi:hypothetical protein